MLICGKVCCEASDGRLNASSVLLEGSNGVRVKLDLEAMKHEPFSLFPGQVIAVQGSCPTGRVCVAKRVYDDVNTPRPSTNAGELIDMQFRERQDGRPLSIFSVSGPYTKDTDIEWRPLEALLHDIKTDKPDVVIMCGPFVDAHHPMVAAGEVYKEVDIDDSHTSSKKERVYFTYQEMFELLMSSKWNSSRCILFC